MSDGPYVGDIIMVAFNFAPPGWEHCDGQILQITEQKEVRYGKNHVERYTVTRKELFAELGNRAGGDGKTTFALPDFRGRVPVHVAYPPGTHNVGHLFAGYVGRMGGEEKHALKTGETPQHHHTLLAVSDAGQSNDPGEKMLAQASGSLGATYGPPVGLTSMAAAAVTSVGSGEPHDNMQPFLGVNFIIAVDGASPSTVKESSVDRWPFLGEIRIVPFNYAPAGWALCDGQILRIAQNSALFSLLGATYGGHGTQEVPDFALPDLRGRVPIHRGQGAGLTKREMGDHGGHEAVTLTSAQLGSHTHSLMGSSGAGAADAPQGNVPATAGRGHIYSSAAPNSALAAGSVGIAGGGVAHENRQPFLALNFIICMEGVFPPRS